jgi:hypothetical protein
MEENPRQVQKHEISVVERKQPEYEAFVPLCPKGEIHPI